MKNTMRLFGIIALVAVIGFTMAGCGEDASSDDEGGTFTLTGIPQAYNGKYAYLSETWGGAETSVGILGATSVNMSTATATLPKVENQQVSIPMWKVDMTSASTKPYSGSDTVRIIVVIYDQAQYPLEIDLDEEDDDKVQTVWEFAVTFTGGNATKEWSAGHPW
jgi:hypothetical protein